MSGTQLTWNASRRSLWRAIHGSFNLSLLSLLLVDCSGCKTAERLRDRTSGSDSVLSAPEYSSADVTDNTKAEINLEFAHALERQGKKQKAMGVYRALARKHELPEAYHRLGLLHDKEGEFEKAESMYRKALALSPNSPPVWCDLGYSYYLQQNWAESERCLRRAVQLSPDFARAHNNLGMLFARQGRSDEALDCFAQAGCDEAGARSNLALALLAAHQTEPARTQLDLALRADNTHRQAITMMKGIERARLQTLANVQNPSLPPGPQQVRDASATFTTEDVAVRPVAFRHHDHDDVP